MEYIFYKISRDEYDNPNNGYDQGPILTSQDDPSGAEVMDLLRVQAPNYFADLDNLYNNKYVIIVDQIEVGYTYWMLTPLDIAYQIERIQNAKANIKLAINSKGGNITNETIDEYAGKINTLPVVVELTQAQYDALSVYDNNTYYLIVEA